MKSSHVAQARKGSVAIDSVADTFAHLVDTGYGEGTAGQHVTPCLSHLFSLSPPFLQRCAGQEVETFAVLLGRLSGERQ